MCLAFFFTPGFTMDYKYLDTIQTNTAAGAHIKSL